MVLNVKRLMSVLPLGALISMSVVEAKATKSIETCIAHGTPSTVIKELKNNGHNDKRIYNFLSE